MIREVAFLVGILVAMIYLLAVGPYFKFGGQTVADYGAYVMYVSFACGVLGFAFANGPSVNRLDITQSRFEADVSKHDRADRESARSFGLHFFLAAALAGGGGYLLTRL